MRNLIRHILIESSQEKFINLMVDKIRFGVIKAPYFKNLEEIYGLSDEEIESTLSKSFNGKVNLRKKQIRNETNDELYQEESDGYWEKWEYNEWGHITYKEDSDGYWAKWEYDERGNAIYYEDSNGIWVKREYDERGNKIYYEDSNDIWVKWGYDEMGDVIYKESSSRGVIIDKR